MLFEALREMLLRGGIAPWRVRRYLAELNDHLADLTEQERAAGYAAEEAAIRARVLLGGDTELAEPWLTDPRLKSLSARAPWFVFVLAPPFAIIAAFLVSALLLVVIGDANGWMGPHAAARPDWYRQFASLLAIASNLLLPVLLTSLLSAVADRQRLPLKWPVIAVLLVALLNLHMHIDIPSRGLGSVQLSALPALLAGTKDWLPTVDLGPEGLVRNSLTLTPLLWLFRRKTQRS